MKADLTPEALDALMRKLTFEAVNSEIDRQFAGEIGATITALRAEIEALQREVNEQEARANENKARATAAEAALARTEANRDAVLANLHEAQAALAAAMEGAVMVKPLKWRGMKCETDSRYSISYWDVEKLYVDSHTTMQRHATLEEAKAAAQFDYESRILAALEPNPAAQDREANKRTERMHRRAQKAEGRLARMTTCLATAIDLYEQDGKQHAHWLRAAKNAVRSRSGTAYDMRFSYLYAELKAVEQDREALIAATLERAAQVVDRRKSIIEVGTELSDKIRSLATQPQTDALAARDAKMRDKLLDAIGRIPRRIEPLGGQSHSYVNWGEVMAVFAAAQKESK